MWRRYLFGHRSRGTNPTVMSEEASSASVTSDEGLEDVELQLAECNEPESLKDSNRSKKLLDVAYRSWKSSLYTDVTVVVGSQRFSAHRLVLSSLSDYFPPLLKFDKTEFGEVTLHNIDPDDFYVLLNYAYSGDVDITKENVQNVLIASDYLNIDHIKHVCIKFMASNLDTDNVCDLLLFGLEYPISELAESSKKFLKENLDEVSRTDKFFQLDPKFLEVFFDDDNLVLYSGKVSLKSADREKLILKSVLRYLSNRSVINPDVIEMMIRTVRLPQIPKEELLKCLNDFKTLKINEIIKKYVKLREILAQAVKDSKQNVSRMSSTQEIPIKWSQPRKLASFSVDQRGRRYAADGQITLSPNPPGYSHNSCNLEIKRIEIWLRIWDNKSVIGGLSLTYRGASIDGRDLVHSRGHCQGRRDYHIIELEPEEFIIKVMIGSGWLIDRMGFETNRGRVLGPFGGTGGAENTELAPPGPLSYLFDINCDSVNTQGSDAIFNLVLRWITFI